VCEEWQRTAQVLRGLADWPLLSREGDEAIAIRRYRERGPLVVAKTVHQISDPTIVWADVHESKTVNVMGCVEMLQMRHACCVLWSAEP